MEKKFRPKLYIKESNKIEGIKGDREIEQSMKAWEYLKTRKKLRHLDVCRVQAIITKNQLDLEGNERGYYRNVSQVDVTVGGRTAPSHKQIDSFMENWLNDLPKMSPIIAHIRFETIHPFVDGNGRTGRMIYWWHLQQVNKVPRLFTGKERQKYYTLFDDEKIEALQKNNWGIGFGVPKYEATIKTKEGQLIRGAFLKKPTEKMIKESIPKGHEFDSVVQIKKL